MDFLSGTKVECLFKKDSFLNAISRKDIETVKSDILTTCSFHLDAMLNTPVCRWLRTKNPERFEQVRQQHTLEFEQEIEWLAETIIDMVLGALTQAEINPEPLINAFRQNRIDALKFYFWIGGTPNLKTKVDPINQSGGENLIHYAADLDDTSIMMFMIENGADVNAKTVFAMETPIHRAVMSGNQDMVRLLWGCGADIDAVNSDGETALMLATKNSDPAMVYFLLRLGADFKVTDTDGHSAFDLAKMHSSDGIIEMLTAREAGMEYPKIEEYVYFKPARPDEMN